MGQSGWFDRILEKSPTAGEVESVGGSSGSVDGDGWVGLVGSLDSPIYHCLILVCLITIEIM